MSAQSSDLLGLYDNGQSTQSAGLAFNLSSNNPFRNRAVSPNSFSPPHSPFDDPPPRPTSRNPFLDPTQPATGTSSSSDKMASSKDQKSFTAEDFFGSLSLEDKDAKSRPSTSKASVNRPSGGPPRSENNPPRGRGAPPSSSHKPTQSQEEALRARRIQSSNRGDKGGLSPQKKPTDRRPRRNSDSSMLEKPLADEDKRARELKRKERERRHRDRDGKDKKTGRKLDIIDQLDATGIYGTGLFHHDGPFDACNPHRNRKGSRRAPMQAFAKDSANNSIGGAGPLNQRPDHMQFMGREPHDVSNMFGGGVVKEKSGSKSETTFFDPKQASEFVPGEETLGLGSSTFLEGTPAARSAIQRNQAETAQEVLEQGLGRKKSVVQRFRSIKRVPREYNDAGRVRSPDDGYYTPKTGDLGTGGSNGERNPFFAEFDNSDERITVKRKDSGQMSPISPPPLPSAGLERRATNDGITAESDASRAGFLSRVRSLKGGRRQRPEPPSKDMPAGMAI